MIIEVIKIKARIRKDCAVLIKKSKCLLKGKIKVAQLALVNKKIKKKREIIILTRIER